MRQTSRCGLLLVFLALGGLTVAGCGGGLAKPGGQLLMNGQPYKLADTEKVSISFSSSDPGKTAASASAAQDGSFAVEGEGLQPGSYVVSVISINSKAPGGEKYKDKFNNAFNGASSPLKVEIVSGASPSIAIDLGRRLR